LISVALPDTINAIKVRSLARADALQLDLPEPARGECIIFGCNYCYTRRIKGDSRCSCGCNQIIECNFNNSKPSMYVVHGKSHGEKRKCSHRVFNKNHILKLSLHIKPLVEVANYQSSRYQAQKKTEQESKNIPSYILVVSSLVIVGTISFLVALAVVRHRRHQSLNSEVAAPGRSISFGPHSFYDYNKTAPVS